MEWLAVVAPLIALVWIGVILTNVRKELTAIRRLLDRDGGVSGATDDEAPGR